MREQNQGTDESVNEEPISGTRRIQDTLKIYINLYEKDPAHVISPTIGRYQLKDVVSLAPFSNELDYLIRNTTSFYRHQVSMWSNGMLDHCVDTRL